MYDEPREIDTDNPRPMGRTRADLEKIFTIANETGVKTSSSWDDRGDPRIDDASKRANYFELTPMVSYVTCFGNAPQSNKSVSEAHRLDKTLLLYNNGMNRYAFGVATFKLGAKGNSQFMYDGPVYPNPGYQYYSTVACIMAKEGPIPTVNWEWVREGIDDYKYFYTLETLVKAASGRKDEKLAPLISSAESVLNEARKTTMDTSAVNIVDAESTSTGYLKFKWSALDALRAKTVRSILELLEKMR